MGQNFEIQDIVVVWRNFIFESSQKPWKLVHLWDRESWYHYFLMRFTRSTHNYLALASLSESFDKNAKGQLISKGLFGFFNSHKKRTKNFCLSRLGQKLTLSSLFFGRIEYARISFWDLLTLSHAVILKNRLFGSRNCWTFQHCWQP